MRLALFLLPLIAATATAAVSQGREAKADARAAQRTARAEAGLARELSGLRAGATTGCLPIQRQSQTRSYDDTFVYVVSRGLKYVTTTSGGCGSLDRDLLLTTTPIGRVCRGDIAQTFDRVSRFPTGGCSFGDFTEYRRP